MIKNERERERERERETETEWREKERERAHMINTLEEGILREHARRNKEMSNLKET